MMGASFMKLGRAPTTWRIFTALPCARPPAPATGTVIQTTWGAEAGGRGMGDDEAALIEYEVEPNYAGWTLAAYVAEKLKRPLPGDRLERMLRSRALVHAERELLPETPAWPGLKFPLPNPTPGAPRHPPEVPG